MSLAKRMLLVDECYIDMLKKYGGTSASNSENKGSKRDVEDDESSIILTLPKTYRSKGEALIAFLRDNGISKSKSQQLMVNGDVVPGTNYVDIIHDLLRYRDLPSPDGFSILGPILKSLNISRKLVTNMQRYKEIMETESNSCGEHNANPALRRRKRSARSNTKNKNGAIQRPSVKRRWIAW